MRVTSVLCKQHIERMFKKHWRIQKTRVPCPTEAESEMEARGIPVYEPEDIIEEKHEYVK